MKDDSGLFAEQNVSDAIFKKLMVALSCIPDRLFRAHEKIPKARKNPRVHQRNPSDEVGLKRR